MLKILCFRAKKISAEQRWFTAVCLWNSAVQLWNSAEFFSCEQRWCLSCFLNQPWKTSKLWNSAVQRWLPLGLQPGIFASAGASFFCNIIFPQRNFYITFSTLFFCLRHQTSATVSCYLQQQFSVFTYIIWNKKRFNSRRNLLCLNHRSDMFKLTLQWAVEVGSQQTAACLICKF